MGQSSSKYASNLSGEQQQFLNQMLGQLGPQGISQLGSLIGGGSPEEMQALFQKSYVDPAMMAYQQDVLPAIQGQFNALGAGSSSALNQTLARSAGDLSTQLGAQYGQFAAGQQQNSLNALSLLLGQGLGQHGQAVVTQSPLAGILGTAGTLGGAALGNPSLFRR